MKNKKNKVKNKANIKLTSPKTLEELKEIGEKDRFYGYYKTKKRFIN
ncbi:MAG: hypothetical protein U9N59_12440 [Campylobacterota bacterium]|nr:hypothetical protein [Campylobacterota bacterium]